MKKATKIMADLHSRGGDQEVGCEADPPPFDDLVHRPCEKDGGLGPETQGQGGCLGLLPAELNLLGTSAAPGGSVGVAWFPKLDRCP